MIQEEGHGIIKEFKHNLSSEAAQLKLSPCSALVRIPTLALRLCLSIQTMVMADWAETLGATVENKLCGIPRGCVHVGVNAEFIN